MKQIKITIGIFDYYIFIFIAYFIFLTQAVYFFNTLPFLIMKFHLVPRFPSFFFLKNEEKNFLKIVSDLLYLSFCIKTSNIKLG